MGAALPVAMGFQALSTGYGVYLAQQSGKMNQRYLNFQADQADGQAKVVEAVGEAQAHAVQDNAAEEFKGTQRDYKKLKGTQKAALAANGVQGVTAEDIARDTLSAQDIEEQAIRMTADSRAASIKANSAFEAGNLRAEASGYRSSGRMARRGANLQSTATLLGGASQIAGTAYKWRKG